MLIGISGPSCSGKTTLAREIGRLLEAPVLHLDRYFLSDAARPVVDGHPSFEQPHQYDGAALLRDARRALCENDIVVVEGFLLFAYHGFELECLHMIHLDVPHEVLAERRRIRTERKSATSDVEGGRKASVDAAWQAHGQSEWQKWGRFQRDIPGMQVVTSQEHGGSYPSSPEEIARHLIERWESIELQGA